MPRVALADAGVPMLIVMMPTMAASLLPIILIEAYILKSRLNLTTKSAISSSALANIFSTFVGVPFTWLVLVIAEHSSGSNSGFYKVDTLSDIFSVAILQAPWLPPLQDSSHFWMVPIAMLVLLVPFFFISWYAEYRVIRKINPALDPAAIKAAARTANLVTYALLALYPVWLYTVKY